MKKTKIDWADSTWNPVTGCLYGCEYCYARKIAERFGSNQMPIFVKYPVLDEPVRCADTYELMRIAGISAGKIQPYPFDFTPTFHRYKLDEPQHWKKPRTIFVCSMADLFGAWVPDEWIQDVFKACDAAPQHRYLFLTKNPKRYAELSMKGIKPPTNSWIGTSATTDAEAKERTLALSECWNVNANWFVSVEPILEKMSGKGLEDLSAMHWIIIGAETGNRKRKVVPEKAWIDEIADACARAGTPLFMKESLQALMGNDFRQEFPWEAEFK